MVAVWRPVEGVQWLQQSMKSRLAGQQCVVWVSYNRGQLMEWIHRTNFSLCRWKWPDFHTRMNRREEMLFANLALITLKCLHLYRTSSDKVFAWFGHCLCSVFDRWAVTIRKNLGTNSPRLKRTSIYWQCRSIFLRQSTWPNRIVTAKWCGPHIETEPEQFYLAWGLTEALHLCDELFFVLHTTDRCIFRSVTLKFKWTNLFLFKMCMNLLGNRYGNGER